MESMMDLKDYEDMERAEGFSEKSQSWIWETEPIEFADYEIEVPVEEIHRTYDSRYPGDCTVVGRFDEPYSTLLYADGFHRMVREQPR